MHKLWWEQIAVRCLQWRSDRKLNAARELGTSLSVVTVIASRCRLITVTGVTTRARLSVRCRRRWRDVNRVCTRHHRTIHAGNTSSFLPRKTVLLLRHKKPKPRFFKYRQSPIPRFWRLNWRFSGTTDGAGATESRRAFSTPSHMPASRCTYTSTSRAGGAWSSAIEVCTG